LDSINDYVMAYEEEEQYASLVGNNVRSPWYPVRGQNINLHIINVTKMITGSFRALPLAMGHALTLSRSGQLDAIGRNRT
jgi:hypothetical protein